MSFKCFLNWPFYKQKDLWCSFMYYLKISSYNVILILFTVNCISCRNQDITSRNVKADICYVEINKQYHRHARINNDIYMINDVSEDSIVVSIWHNNRSWLFLNKKKRSYFDESKYFTYRKVSCPGVSELKGISDKINFIGF